MHLILRFICSHFASWPVLLTRLQFKLTVTVSQHRGRPSDQHYTSKACIPPRYSTTSKASEISSRNPRDAYVGWGPCQVVGHNFLLGPVFKDNDRNR